MADTGTVTANSLVSVWKKRITAATKLYEEWEQKYRVRECYNYYNGDQLAEPKDRFGNRKAQINLIHPEVRNNIPSLYYYRPYARLTAEPEHSDDPGTEIEKDTLLLQDTANYLVRDSSIQFRDATFIGLKEAHWAFGLAEVGYSAEFSDTPAAEDKPPLKEKKDTKGVGKKEPAQQTLPGFHPMPTGEMMPGAIHPGTDEYGMSVDPMASDLASVEAEYAALRDQLKSERFYVKHIPANQCLVSKTDKPIIENNDWIGYWEDVPLQDVKRSKAYKNTKDLKAAIGDEARNKSEAEYTETVGGLDKVRLYKIWDLRTKKRYVFAEAHDKELLEKPYNRLPLKFLRFDIDPYHFYPRPLLLSKLGPQDEYNQSREYIRKERIARVARYTYDADAVTKANIEKLESGESGVAIPRKAGTTPDVIAPVNQPSFSGDAIQSLTLSKSEFAEVGGVGGDLKVAQSKTATQAKIGETKEQAQDSFDRQLVADWLASIIKELVQLAVENMTVDRFIAINIAPDNQLAPQLTVDTATAFQRINANVLGNAAKGINWDVLVDVESLWPVAEEERFQKWMQGLTLLGNQVMARLFSVSPTMLNRTLDLLGVKSGKDKALVAEAMQAVVQMEAQLAAQSQNAAPGVSPQSGGPAPGAPKVGGGPQPGGPAGPGAS